MSKSQENQRKNKQNSQSSLCKCFFELTYLTTRRAYPKQYIDSLLFLLNFAQITIVFLNFDLISIIQPGLLIFELNITIGLSAFLGLIFLQIFIGLVYQWQFYLCLQFKFYRYLLYPVIIRYFCSQLNNKTVIPESACLLAIASLFLVTWALSLPFSQQSFTESSILPKTIPVNSYFLPFETLLFLAEHSQQALPKKALIALLFFYSLILKFSVLKQYPKITIQERVVRTIANQFVLLTFILFYSSIIPNGISKSLVFCFIPIVLMILLQNILRQKRIPSEVVNVFETDSLKGQQFIQRIQYFVEQMRFVSQAQVPQFIDSLVVAFCEETQKQNNPNCQLMFEIKKGLLKSFGQQKSMKKGLIKVARKIQSLFQDVIKNQPENPRIKISMLKFYIICLPNKNRMVQLLAQINRKNLSIFLEMDIHNIEKQVNMIGVSQNFESLSKDECINQFHAKMLTVLNCITQFWTELLEQSVDLNKLMAISQKLYPLKRNMEKECDTITNFQNYSAVIILKTYAEYARIILNQEKNSIIIQQYAIALKRRLLEMREIKTLSSDSETATIALSLSEGSLGVIKMVNPQAAFIFGYLKSEISKLRVNDIMPKTIARHHDDILLSYLSHRNKMVNTDERQMIGKSKNGYVFPIILQLQSAIASANQQLIFIANIKKTKFKSSPILCLVNQEGVIQQVSSMFSKLFLGKKKMKNDLNIQEVIPDFFANNFKSGEIQNFNVSAKVQTYMGVLEVFFKVSQINLPCRNNVGYIVKGHFRQQIYKTKPSITDRILEKKEQGDLKGNATQYCSQKNQFYIESKVKNLSLLNQFDQYTIPFFSISNMADVLAIDNKQNIYDNEIKAVRLNKDHLERVEEPSSFHSQQYSESDTKAGLKKKLSEIKDGMASEQEKFTFRVKILVLAISILMAAYLGILTVAIDSHSQNIINLSHIQKNMLLSRSLIAEFVAYFTAIDANIDSIRYQSKRLALEKQLIEVLNQADITQLQKQEALKVLYLKNASNLPVALSNQNLGFNLIELKDQARKVSLQTFFFILLVGIISLGTVLIVSFVLLVKKIEDTYSIFLTLDQKTIRQILQSCLLFSKKIQVETNGGQESSKVIKYDDDQEESPVQKFKKFKNRTNSKTRLYLVKLLAPILIFLAFTAGIMICGEYQQTAIQIDHRLHIYSSSLNSQCSVATMKTLLKKVRGISLNLDSTFEQEYQNIQNNIEKILKQKQQKKEQLYKVLLTNPCGLQGLPSNCETFLNGVMKGGLSKAINYLAIGLKGLQQNIVPGSMLGQLLYLQFEIIKPVLNQLNDKILHDVQENALNGKQLLQSLTIILVVVILLGSFYLCKYPIEGFNDQLTSISQLTKLIPTNHRKPESNGYLKLDW